MSKQFYQTLCETTYFQNLWAEGYTLEETYDLVKQDYTYLDDDMNSRCDLNEIHIAEGYNYLDTKMKEHFLAIYNLSR